MAIELPWTPTPLVRVGLPEQLSLDRRFTFDSVLNTGRCALREFDSVASRIGGTPLIEIPHERGGASIFGKAEFLNAFSTVKARPAMALLLNDLVTDRATNLTERNYISYGGSSFPLALAGLVRAAGANLTLFTGTFLPPEQRAAVESLGATLKFVDKKLGFHAIIDAAAAFAAANPRFKLLHQHLNRPALDTHYLTTGAELTAQAFELKESGYAPAALVGSIGTGGSLIGSALRLRRSQIKIRVFATTPAEQPYGDPAPPNGEPKFAGSGGFGYGRRQMFVAPFEDMIEGHITVSYQTSLVAAAEFADVTGLPIGTSAAANWMAARRVARSMPPHAAVICILPGLASGEERSAGAIELVSRRSAA